MKRSMIGRFFGMAVASLLAYQAAAQAQSPEEFYKGKTVTLLLAAAAGGFADTVARAFVGPFQQHFPGNPQIVVVNQPGAGGMLGASRLQTSAEKDGTVIGFLLGNNLTTPLVTGKEEQFDPRKVQWIGAIESGDYPYAFYVFKSSPVQSVDELFKKSLVVGSTSFTNYNRVFPAMMNSYLGTKIDIVAGYKGSGEVYLALERGEVDGWIEGAHAIDNETNKAGQFIAEGRMKPLMLMGLERNPKWPNLPVIMEYIKKDDQKAVARFMLASSRAGRPIAVPAEVPADRVAAIRKAFNDTFADPEFVPYMQKRLQTQIVGEQTAEDIEQMVTEFYATPAPVLETVRSFMVKK